MVEDPDDAIQVLGILENLNLKFAKLVGEVLGLETRIIKLEDD